MATKMQIPEVQLTNDITKLDRQIKALKSIIPKDNQKDKIIHKQALKELQDYRDKLLKSKN